MFKKIAFDRLSQGLDQYLSLIKAKFMKKILQMFVLSISLNSLFFFQLFNYPRTSIARRPQRAAFFSDFRGGRPCLDVKSVNIVFLVFLTYSFRCVFQLNWQLELNKVIKVLYFPNAI